MTDDKQQPTQADYQPQVDGGYEAAPEYAAASGNANPAEYDAPTGYAEPTGHETAKGDEAIPGYEGPSSGYPQEKPPAPARPPTLGPHRTAENYAAGDDPSDPAHYTRDPHKLTAYLVPFPNPKFRDAPPETIPHRFLVYTPPPPPLTKPAEGEKEAKIHKVQRKWQEEVREAKTTQAKTASWKGVKSKVTRGIDWAISHTTSSSVDFLNRIGDDADDEKKKRKSKDGAHPDGHEGHETQEDEPTKPVGLTDLILVYPDSFSESPEAMREEFVKSMLRTKSKAQRDAILATGLLPVSLAIDFLAMLVWPFGGLFEIDSVWAYSSIRGAKIASSTTKRLTASANDGSAEEKGKGKEENEGGKDKTSKDNEKHLQLNFTPSGRVNVLYRYLVARCHERDPKMFPPAGGSPTETEVLRAIGWAPSQTGEERQKWADEQWEMTGVKEDLKQVMTKGAKEWDKWCKAFEKNPKKALKK